MGKKDHSDSEQKKPGQPEKDKHQNSDKTDASRKWHHRASKTEADALKAMLGKRKKAVKSVPKGSAHRRKKPKVKSSAAEGSGHNPSDSSTTKTESAGRKPNRQPNKSKSDAEEG